MRIANNLVGRKAVVDHGRHRAVWDKEVEIVALIRTRHGWLVTVLYEGRLYEDLPMVHLRVLSSGEAAAPGEACDPKAVIS